MVTAPSALEVADGVGETARVGVAVLTTAVGDGVGLKVAVGLGVGEGDASGRVAPTYTTAARTIATASAASRGFRMR
jgi:hypothetical protein